MLELRRDASAKELRSAYHRLALELHPDKSDDRKSNAKFIRVSEAYAVLSDVEKRAAYDRSLPRRRSKAGGGPQQFQFTFDLNDAKRMMEAFKRDSPELHGAAQKLAAFVQRNLHLVPGAAAAAAVFAQQQEVLFSRGVDRMDWEKLEQSARSVASGVKRAFSNADGSVAWGRVAAVGAATTAAVASALDAIDEGNRTESVLAYGKSALRGLSGWLGSRLESSEGTARSTRRRRKRPDEL